MAKVSNIEVSISSGRSFVSKASGRFFFSPTLVCMMSVRADIPNMVRHTALVVITEAPPIYSSAHLFMRRSQSNNSVLGSVRIES